MRFQSFNENWYNIFLMHGNLLIRPCPGVFKEKKVKRVLKDGSLEVGEEWTYAQQTKSGGVTMIPKNHEWYKGTVMLHPDELMWPEEKLRQLIRYMGVDV